MTLSGKEIRVLLGACTLFLHVPFIRSSSRSSSAFEYDELERLYEELYGELELQANLADADPYMVKVAKRLSVSLWRKFDQTELQLLIDVLAICIKGAKGDTDLNVYFSGDDYGIVLDDFKRLLARLKNLR